MKYIVKECHLFVSPWLLINQRRDSFHGGKNSPLAPLPISPGAKDKKHRLCRCQARGIKLKLRTNPIWTGPGAALEQKPRHRALQPYEQAPMSRGTASCPVNSLVTGSDEL